MTAARNGGEGELPGGEMPTGHVTSEADLIDRAPTSCP